MRTFYARLTPLTFMLTAALAACGTGQSGGGAAGESPPAAESPAVADPGNGSAPANAAENGADPVDLGTAAIDPAGGGESALDYISPTAHFRANVIKSFLFTPAADGRMRIDFDITSWTRSCISGSRTRYELFLDSDDHKVGEFQTFGGFGHGRNTLPILSHGTYRLKVSVALEGADCKKPNEAGFHLTFSPKFL